MAALLTADAHTVCSHGVPSVMHVIKQCNVAVTNLWRLLQLEIFCWLFVGVQYWQNWLPVVTDSNLCLALTVISNRASRNGSSKNGIDILWYLSGIFLRNISSIFRIVTSENILYYRLYTNCILDLLYSIKYHTIM